MRIWITHQFPAYHKWKDAPDEVEFLRSMHRHMFKIKLMIDVYNDNRELELFIVQRKLKTYCEEEFEEDEDIGSCEMIGNKIKKQFEEIYPGRMINVEVSEDGENGVIV